MSMISSWKSTNWYSLEQILFYVFLSSCFWSQYLIIMIFDSVFQTSEYLHKFMNSLHADITRINLLNSSNLVSEHSLAYLSLDPIWPVQVNPPHLCYPLHQTIWYLSNQMELVILIGLLSSLMSCLAIISWALLIQFEKTNRFIIFKLGLNLNTHEFSKLSDSSSLIF